jgi:hypothetical protein
MNPFLWKAHPLLEGLIRLVTDPASLTVSEASDLLLIVLGINLIWAAGLFWITRRGAGIRLPLFKAYLLALPATLLYAPLVITVVGDVADHAFRFQDRALVVFAIFVASQTLAGFYAFALRQGVRGDALGLAGGVTVSLFLLLLSMPACGLLLAVNAFLRVV